MTALLCLSAIEMQCLILAGGFGRRMLPATESLPKCLLPVVDRPFVDWQLAWLVAEQVDRVVLSIGYRGDLVRRHVGDGRRFGLEVDYVDEGDHLLGTAGALRLAVDQGVLDCTFLVVYGDSYLQLHLRPVEAEHARRDAPALMTVYRALGRLEHPNAVFEDGMVVRYEKGLAEPPPEMCYVDYGLSIWRSEVIEALVPSGGVADMATSVHRTKSCWPSCWLRSSRAVLRDRIPGGLRDLEALLGAGGVSGSEQMARNDRGTPLSN